MPGAMVNSTINAWNSRSLHFSQKIDFGLCSRWVIVIHSVTFLVKIKKL